MNRTPRLQPTPAMGFAAQGIGSSRDTCIIALALELLASSKVGAQPGSTATK
jgi:hypothetical protein